MTKYAVFIDIDGTLYDKGYIHPENVRAINEATAAGHYIFINTGRGYSFIPKEVLGCACFYGVVAGIGAHIVMQGKTVKSVNVDKDSLKFVVSLFEDTDVAVRYQGEENFYYQNKPNPEEGEVLLSSEKDIDNIFDEMKISKFTCYNKKPSSETIEKLKNKFFVVEYDHCIEMTTKGQNKAVGMLDAAKILGVPVENCIAIGDSENDIDVLKAAGISVAMGNSADEIKKMCSFVTTDCKDGGVAYAIDKLVLKK